MSAGSDSLLLVCCEDVILLFSLASLIQSSIHCLDEVRMKAIRLVANKLFPMASISKRIEDFANEKLNSLLSHDGGTENLSSSVADAQTLMSLYFALCTKKHSLLWHVFAMYGRLPRAAKQVRVACYSLPSQHLGIISDPPADSQDLLMQVLQTLTDGAVPSQDLISSVKNLYSKTKEIEVLFSVLSHLPKDEVFLHPSCNIEYIKITIEFMLWFILI
ncbi:hypothetical protein GUJ93_ZPchr2169g6436 [Zizania palustris]|uniref:Uncharacterized protein n=1 Tax=Zizania palustris TaxID=103762 RepID=A0A8J5UZC5_ZIZPA|nr:hypothetical protein GUJ93_ZPchr2169g6436 [Zizania palustris]